MDSLCLGDLLRDAKDARDVNSCYLESRDHKVSSVCYAIMLASTAVVVSTFPKAVVEWFRFSQSSLLGLRWGGAFVAMAGLASALKVQGRGIENVRAARSIPTLRLSAEHLYSSECPPEIVEVMTMEGARPASDFRYALQRLLKRSYPGQREVGSIPSESAVGNFIKRSDDCRVYLNALLLFTQSEQYRACQSENSALFDRAQLLQLAQGLETVVADFVRNLKQHGYTFEKHSLDEFFHPKKLCDAGALIDSNRGEAMQVWEEFKDSQLCFYYLKLRESTELIQRFQQLPGQLGTKSARKRSQGLSTLGLA